MSDHNQRIDELLDKDVNGRIRAEAETMRAIGTIADSLVEIAQRLYEIAGLLEDWKDLSTTRK